jgi:hypothetical protein
MIATKYSVSLVRSVTRVDLPLGIGRFLRLT